MTHPKTNKIMGLNGVAQLRLRAVLKAGTLALAPCLVVILVFLVPGLPAFATVANASNSSQPAAEYQLSLGDSLALTAGAGASTASNDYVNEIAAHEGPNIPNLHIEDLACGGATTNSMIDGSDPANTSCQSYTGGTQLSAAEAFLQSHQGQVPYITIDIGINNVDVCPAGGPITTGCIASGLSEITTQLPVILQGLQSAAPGVPIFGMDYYNPFLADWVMGGAEGPNAAIQSVPQTAVLDSTLVNTYGANHAVAIAVDGTFAIRDSAMTGTWDGVTVPQNVYRTCELTHMCDSSGANVHPNDLGYAKLAAAFEQQIDRSRRGGGQGTWLTDSEGHVHITGTATDYGSLAGQRLNAPIVTMAATNDGLGYWLVASDGGVFTFGDARFFGSTGGLVLNKPIVGFVPTSDNQGYWLVASDGGIFAFGDAQFLGSMGGIPLDQPIVGMAQTGSDLGYWLVAADGGIFAFGDAQFYGSMGGVTLAQPVVGMAGTIDGGGYWLVARDGGIFSFGDAVFHGSAGGIVLNKPIIGMTLPPGGYGYTMGASDGGLFAFGNANFNGSLAGTSLGTSVVAVVSN